MSDELALLVERAQAGSREAFSRLAGEQWPRLIRLVRSITANKDCEDVAQEALIKAWKNLPALRTPSAFPAWLNRIAVNVALRYARRSSLALVALDTDGNPACEAIAAGAGQQQVEQRLDVAAVLRLLSPRQRVVLHLTHIEGMTDSEISRVLGISASSVRAHRLAARRSVALKKGAMS